MQQQASKKIKVLLVDDMPAVRENLSLLLQLLDNIEIVGEAADVDTARKLIFKHRPNLVFLDINLPEKDGFELLDELTELPEIEFDVVFVTAHSEYAAKAFEYYPFHFLVKPVERQKLNQLIEKYANQKLECNFRQRVNELKQIKSKLHFKGHLGHLWVSEQDIMWCKAERNYTSIYLNHGEKEMISENLSNIERQLNKDLFYKSHRSFIVNINYVRKINRISGKVFMSNNPFNESPFVSKDKTKELIDLLDK